ncbi:MAG: HAD-IB family hydrolase [Chitinophagaceae bacterium]
MKKNIAFFDFDGTITTVDTLLAFIKFSQSRLRFYGGFLYCSPILLAYKMRLIANHVAKEKVLQFFFRGNSLGQFEDCCSQFSANKLPGLIRPGALLEIERLQQRNFTVVIVSASPENWIREWAAKHGAELIATKLEVKQETLTGKLLGSNCYGEEKVRRIESRYELKQYEQVYAFGDTAGDKPMLRLATSSFYKPFRN